MATFPDTKTALHEAAAGCIAAAVLTASAAKAETTSGGLAHLSPPRLPDKPCAGHTLPDCGLLPSGVRAQGPSTRDFHLCNFPALCCAAMPGTPAQRIQ